MSTPLQLEKWRKHLECHPDKEFAMVLLRGIAEGFRIGYNATHAHLKQKTMNMLSAAEHPTEVSKYLADETSARRVVCVGPSAYTASMGIHCNPFGVIPKKNRVNKWRLIVNLSAPNGYSVNDGIDKELGSVSYISVDDIANCILQLGKGALLAKMDHIEMYQFTQKTDGCWECSGKTGYTWTPACHLG